jgi:tetratricopeptide (TPR) repeat protein
MVCLPAFASPSDDAWASLWADRNDIARAQFTAAAKADPHDASSFLGLALLDEAEDRPLDLLSHAFAIYAGAPGSPEALGYWDRFQQVATSTAQWNTLGSAASHVLDSPQASPELKAAAKLALAKSLEERGKLLESRQARASLAFLTLWNVIGPFDNPAGTGFDRVYPPEQTVQLKGAYTGRTALPLKWRPATVIDPEGNVQLATQLEGTGDDVYYASTAFALPADVKVSMTFDPHGASKVYVNGHLVFSESVYRLPSTTILAGYTIPVNLTSGWNTVLVKLIRTDSVFSGASFRMRLTDQAGSVLINTVQPGQANGVHITSSPTAKRAESTVAAAMRDLIPTPQTLLLAADAALRNGDSGTAITQLTKALLLVPGSGILQARLSRAYSAAGRASEAGAATDAAARVNPKLIDAQLARYRQASSNLKPKDRIARLKALLAISPTSPSVLGALALEYSTENMKPEAAAAIKAQLPANSSASGLAWAAQSLAAAGERQVGPASVLARGLERMPYDPDLLLVAGADAMQSGQKSRAAGCYERALALNPVDCDTMVMLADVYASMGRNRDAATLTQKLTALKPFSAQVWTRLGDYRSAAGMAQLAAAAYTTALAIDPSLSDLRVKIQKYVGASSPMDLVAPISIDAVMPPAPPPAPLPTATPTTTTAPPPPVAPPVVYTGAPAITLLDEQKRIYFADGAMMARRHRVVRIITPAGAAKYATLQLTPLTGTSMVTVENIRIYRAAGDIEDITHQATGLSRPIRALLPGDTLDVKYRESDFNPAGMKGQFWADFTFDHPGELTKLSRFVLFTSPATTYRVRLHGAPSGTTRTLGKWKVTEWRADLSGRSAPTDASEPVRVDVSTVRDWATVARWLSNLMAPRMAADDTVKSTAMDIVADLDDDEAKVKAIVDYARKLSRSDTPFAMSGFTPVPAKRVVRDLAGDGKDLAAMMGSLLAALNIKSEQMMLLGREPSGGWLPSGRFDRVLTRVFLASGPVWVDLAADPPMYGTPLPAALGLRGLRASAGATSLQTIGSISAQDRKSGQAHSASPLAMPGAPPPAAFPAVDPGITP